MLVATAAAAAAAAVIGLEMLLIENSASILTNLFVVVEGAGALSVMKSSF